MEIFIPLINPTLIRVFWGPLKTLEILPRVRMCPLVHHTSDDTAGPMSYNNGSEGGWDKDDRNTSRARVDSWNSMESSVSDTLPGGLEGSNPSVSASRVRAGWRGGTSEGVSPSSAGWSDSWDNSVSLRGEGRSRSFFNRSDVSKMVNGALVLTTHRVLFVGGKRNEARRTLVEMPLAFITKMKIEYRLCKGLIRLQVGQRNTSKILKVRIYFFCIGGSTWFGTGHLFLATTHPLQGTRCFC